MPENCSDNGLHHWGSASFALFVGLASAGTICALLHGRRRMSPLSSSRTWTLSPTFSPAASITAAGNRSPAEPPHFVNLCMMTSMIPCECVYTKRTVKLRRACVNWQLKAPKRWDAEQWLQTPYSGVKRCFRCFWLDAAQGVQFFASSGQCDAGRHHRNEVLPIAQGHIRNLPLRRYRSQGMHAGIGTCRLIRLVRVRRCSRLAIGSRENSGCLSTMGKMHDDGRHIGL